MAFGGKVWMKIEVGGRCVFFFFVMLESHIARSLPGWWGGGKVKDGGENTWHARRHAH